MEKLRYAVYMRKSTEEEERQVLSLASQRDKIMERFVDLRIVAEFSESKSAFEPDKRPKFKELLELIDAGKIDGVIAWHPDRISRNEVEASAVTWRLRQGKLKDLKFASFSFDNSAEGVMMLQFTMSQGQYFSAKLSKDIKRGNERKRQDGQLTGKAPEGYLNYRTALSGRGEASIIKDEERFPLLRKAFDLFLTGDYSVPAILTILNDEWGYKTVKRRKTGGSGLSRTGLYNVFRNVRYAGFIPDPEDPEHLFKASYPAMITPQEYDEVQTLLGRKGLPRLVTRKQFALRGFIRCGDCDCTVTAQEKRRKLTNGKFNTHTYYHCTGKRKGCSQKSIYIKEDELWAQLLELLDSYELEPQLYEWAMEAFRQFADQEVSERNDVQTMQNQAITNTQTQLDKLLDMATRGLISDDEYKVKNAALKVSLKKLQEEQADTAHRVKSWYEIATDTFEKLTYAGKKFKDGDVATKKDLLLAIGENPVLMNGKLGIEHHEWLIPVRQNAKRLRAELDKVRTLPQQIQKASEEALRTEWCWERDSNPRRRMPADLQSALVGRLSIPAQTWSHLSDSNR
jgi:site-specific DNA recombinase